MHKKNIIILLLISFFFQTYSQTYIKNKSNVFGTWSQQESPYIIEGEAIIPKGKTLIIKPGVCVKFKTGNNCDYSKQNKYLKSFFNIGFLRINGTLKALGNKEKPIIFTRNNDKGKWGLIFFDKAGNNNEIKLLYINHVWRFHLPIFFLEL